MIIVEDGVTKLLTMPISQLNNICKNHEFVLSVRDFPGVPDYMKSLNEVFPDATMDNLREYCKISIKPNNYFDAYVEYVTGDECFVPAIALNGNTLTSLNMLDEVVELLGKTQSIIETLNNLR